MNAQSVVTAINYALGAVQIARNRQTKHSLCYDWRYTRYMHAVRVLIDSAVFNTVTSAGRSSTERYMNTRSRGP